VEEEVLGKAYDGRLMRRLLGYMRPYWRAVFLSLFFLLINSLLQVTGPLLTKIAVDRYLAPRPGYSPGPLGPFLSAVPWLGLAQLSLLYFAALAGVMVFDFLQTYIMQWTGQKAMFDLRRELMAHLQKLDIAYFDRNPTGRLVTRVTTDVDVLNELFASGLVSIAGDLLMLAFRVAGDVPAQPGHDRAAHGRGAVCRAGDHAFPAGGAAELSPYPRGHRRNQLLPAGTRQRDRGPATL